MHRQGQRRRMVGVGVALAVVAMSALTVGVAAAREDGDGQAIRCPSVADRLPAVPARARAEVDRNLALLDTQVAEANARLASSRGEGGPNFVDNAILGPLKSKRVATIERIAIAIGRHAPRPTGLDALAPCALHAAGGPPAVERGPFAKDFVEIRRVARNVANPRPGRSASTGSFTSRCGNNENGHHNPDNMIVAPGVSNGAQHMHDYVGNVSTDGLSTDRSLARAGTTCERRDDRSAYFWPVLRVLGGADAADVNAPGGGLDGNVGQILTPSRVRLEFRGNPQSKVRPMPAFLRVLTGNAKAATTNGLNARAQWTCGGFTDRITSRYPLCPRGSEVIRIADFPSCWDGRNVDSANHRTHIVFPDRRGACPGGTVAVPQLRITLSYDLPQGARFAVDGFPDQLHNPITDHNDFVNVMSRGLMNEVVRCVNSGRRC